MNINREELEKIFNRFEDGYVYATLANDRYELDQGYAYITSVLERVFDPQYHSKLLLLRRRVSKAIEDTEKETPKLIVSPEKENSLTFDTYSPGQQIVRLNGDDRMIFDRELLKEYAFTRLSQNQPVLNPLTNQKIRSVELFVVAHPAGGRRKGRKGRKARKTKKSKRSN
jgi:hypothetical protein